MGHAQWITETAPLFRKAIVAIENLFDPEAIVVGGTRRALLAELIAAAEPLGNSIAVHPGRTAPRIILAEGGANSVLRGAAALAVSGVLSPRHGVMFAEAGNETDFMFHGEGSMTADTPLLQLRDIRMRFGKFEALRGVSFDIRRGEVVALLGDNGAGKSTLVKIISGGLQATSGTTAFDGSERHFANPSEAKAAGIETVYQDLALHERGCCGEFLHGTRNRQTLLRHSDFAGSGHV